MGLFGELFGAAIKVVTLPIAVVKDVADTLEGETPDNTVKQIGSAVKNVGQGISDLSEGDL